MITSESVRDIFAENKIAKVAIIDDAFDPPDSALRPSDLEALFAQLSDGEIRRSLARIGLPLREPADINAEFLFELKSKAATNADGRDAWAVIESNAKARRSALDTLTERLRRGLKVSVKSISAQTARKARKVVPADSNVIFLDYQLDEDEGDLSAELLARIYDQFKDSQAVPLVILMSALRLDEAKIVDFQSRTKLLSGMFYFVPKSELFELEKLHYRLAAFAKSLSTGQTLQRFVHKIEESVDEVRKSVFNDVRTLGIADYAFLQTLCLHEDGQPLGEYLLWVISAHLLKEFSARQEVRQLESEVNGLTFAHLPPTQANPSPALATLYSSAVMRPMEHLPPAPLDPSTYLQFGDVFRKGQTNSLWLCITPACDLSFGPARPIPSGRSILFVPGRLQSLEKPLRDFDRRLPRTELMRLGADTRRVVWQPKEIVRTSWGELRGWLKSLGAKRIGRMHTAFALDIQRGFAAELTRIGMPTPPPVYRPIKVRLSCLDDRGRDVELTSSSTNAALISGGERSQRLVLGSEFMDTVIDMLASAETHAKARLAAIIAAAKGKGPAQIAEAQAAATRLEKARGDADVLSNLRGPHQLPAPGSTQVALDDLLLICNGAAVPANRHWIPLRLELVAAAEVTTATA